MGVMFGVLLDGMIQIFHPMLRKQQIVDLTDTSVIYWIIVGIFLFNLPSLSSVVSNLILR